MNFLLYGRTEGLQESKLAFLLGARGTSKRRALPVRALAGRLLAMIFVLSMLAEAQAGKYPQTIVFMTDFGVVDDSVAICRG